MHGSHAVSLARLVDAGPVPVDMAVYILRELLTVLVHEPGPLRVVAPAHMVLALDGSVHWPESQDAIVRPGLVAFDPDRVCFASPEELDGSLPDEQSHLFGLGVVFHALLTGSKPFGATRDDVLLALFGPSAVAALAAVHASVPDSLRTLAGQLLEPDRAARWPSAQAVLGSLPPCPAGRSLLVEHLSSLVRRSADQDVADACVIGFGPMRGEIFLDKCIGRGGMAEVWHGQRILACGDRHDVAVKKIRPDFALEPEALARFDREARACLAMSHEHVVKVFDYFQRDGQRWLVMEYVDGVSLLPLVEHKVPLPVPVLRSLVVMVLLGLDHIHSHGSLHRDISPGNLMISRQGNLKILDLGLVKPLSGASASSHFNGTPRYASPEALLLEPLDRTSDLYSVAAVFYELLVGIPPYGVGSPAKIAIRQRQRPPGLPDVIPPDFRALFEGLLPLRDKRHYQNAREVLALFMRSDLPSASADTIARLACDIADSECAANSTQRRTVRASARDAVPDQALEAAPPAPAVTPDALPARSSPEHSSPDRSSPDRSSPDRSSLALASPEDPAHKRRSVDSCLEQLMVARMTRAPRDRRRTEPGGLLESPFVPPPECAPDPGDAALDPAPRRRLLRWSSVVALALASLTVAVLFFVGLSWTRSTREASPALVGNPSSARPDTPLPSPPSLQATDVCRVEPPASTSRVASDGERDHYGHIRRRTVEYIWPPPRDEP